jgi:antitoxin component of RelBE/YafQ-DinJ toxin-antitoxin module
MPTTLTKKKQNKVATTIRLDPDLKSWARDFAMHSGTDISTLITITLTQIKNGSRSIELLDPRLIAYNKYLDDMTDRIERGEEKVSGPFSTWEEIEAHLFSLSK